MNKEEYLEKLVDDFGEINGYSEEEKIEFSEMLKILFKVNENEGSHEEIINLIIKNS